MNLGNKSETVEFKKSTDEHKEALRAICAMLNKHGRAARQGRFPMIERLETEGGATYIHVAFSGTDAPYSADGRYFTRVGTSNEAMTAAELQTAMANRAHCGTPWGSLPSGRSFSDINEKAVRKFIEAKTPGSATPASRKRSSARA